MSVVILKITSNKPEFLEKYIYYLKQSFSDNSENIWIEEIHDGYLYMCRNFQIFYLNHRPINEATSDWCHLFEFGNINSESEDITVVDKFPIDGFTIYMEPLSNHVNVFSETLQEYYASIHPDIRIAILNKEKFAITFQNLEAFQTQCAILFSCNLTHKLISISSTLVVK